MKNLKSLFVVLVLLSLPLAVKSQEVTTRVDERVELMGIVFRLAEAQEYSYNVNSPYLDRIKSHFEPYKDHELIQYTKAVRNEYGVSYNAVVALALALDIKKGKVSFRKNTNLSEIDSRWKPDCLKNYIKLLNKFYKQARCEEFFSSNRDYYNAVAQSFEKEITDSVNFKWFADFFGSSHFQKINVTVGLYGAGNYGMKVKNEKGVYEPCPIIGITRTDSLGIPLYDYKSGTIWLIAHELGHSYWNPILDVYREQMMEQAERCFALVKDKMYRQAYGDARTFLGEMVNNATSGLYSLRADPAYDQYSYLCDELSNGFLGIQEVFKSLLEYEKNREKYPTIESYMPVIVETFNSLDPEKIHQNIESGEPEILGTNIQIGDYEVDYNLDSICVYFDKPMSKGCHGLSPITNCSYCNFLEFKKTDGQRRSYWSRDGKTWVVKGVILKPDTNYDFVVPYVFFRSKGGCFMPKSSYYVSFKTRKKE